MFGLSFAMSSCLKMVQAIAVLTSVVIGKAFIFFWCWMETSVYDLSCCSKSRVWAHHLNVTGGLQGSIVVISCRCCWLQLESLWSHAHGKQNLYPTLWIPQISVFPRGSCPA